MSSQPNGGTMEALIETMPILLRAFGDSKEMLFAAVGVAWRDAAGDLLRKLAVPIVFENATLTVAVSDRIWEKQLQSMSNHLLFRMNSILGQPLVRSLKFKVNPSLISDAGAGQLAKPAKDLEPLPSELLLAAACIRDVKLRATFLAAAQKCLRPIIA